jgi:hypothetical protein
MKIEKNNEAANCVVCGKPFERIGIKLTCSKECSIINESKKRKEWYDNRKTGAGYMKQIKQKRLTQKTAIISVAAHENVSKIAEALGKTIMEIESVVLEQLTVDGARTALIHSIEGKCHGKDSDVGSET